MLNRPILFSILFLLIALSSCDGGANTDDVLTPDYVGADTGKVTFDMYPMTRAQMQNTQVYLFNGGTGANRGMYDSRIPSLLSIEENEAEHRAAFSMLAKIGLWNIVLVHAEEASSLAALTPPYRAAGVTMNDLPMWRTLPVGEVLPSVPELMTAHIDDRQVVPNVNNTGSGSMVRNVAQVRINVVRASGLKLGGQHYVRLGGVPTTLSWAGGLLPDRSHPTVGDKLMSQTLTAIADPGDPDNQVSQGDGAVFIIPAHKGFDWPASNPTDTTEQKLTLHVDFELSDGQRFVRSAEIRITPKMNRILSVDLRLDVELGMAVEVLDWEEVDIPADLRQTHIQIDKTNVALSYRDTVFVKSNRPLVATTAASWLSVRPLDDERYEITADVDTYTAQRSGTIDFRADNLTKRIGVTQRPEVGTIRVNPGSVILSPVANPNHSVAAVNVTSTSPWQVLTTALDNATFTATGMAGTTGTINFTRKAPGQNTQPNQVETMTRTTTLAVRNRFTLETAEVSVANLFMRSNDLRVSPPKTITRQDTTVYINPIEVYGGSRQFDVVSWPAWILDEPVLVVSPLPEHNGETKLKIRVAREDGEYKEGNIVFAHADDPSYQITIKVKRMFFTETPPFDFFVLRFSWPSSDVDFIVEFADNFKVNENGDPIIPRTHVPFDFTGSTPWGSGNLSVGYGRRLFFNAAGVASSRSASINGAPSPAYTQTELANNLMFWGGDARNGQGETVFFNAPQITPDFEESDIDDSGLPRTINIDVYGTYISVNPLTMEISTYKGGVMRMPSRDYGVGSLRNTNFYNVDSYTSPMTSFSDVNDPIFYLKATFNQFRISSAANPTRLCRIVYDRWSHEVSDIIWSTNIDTGRYVDQDLWIDGVKYIPPTTRGMISVPVSTLPVDNTPPEPKKE